MCQDINSFKLQSPPFNPGGNTATDTYRIQDVIPLTVGSYEVSEGSVSKTSHSPYNVLVHIVRIYRLVTNISCIMTHILLLYLCKCEVFLMKTVHCSGCMVYGPSADCTVSIHYCAIAFTGKPQL